MREVVPWGLLRVVPECCPYCSALPPQQALEIQMQFSRRRKSKFAVLRPDPVTCDLPLAFQ
jgi:hypothetical protein